MASEPSPAVVGAAYVNYGDPIFGVGTTSLPMLLQPMPPKPGANLRIPVKIVACGAVVRQLP